MSRIKKKQHKRFTIEDSIIQNTGKAIRIASKIFSRRYLTCISMEEDTSFRKGREIFLERHPEIKKYLITDEKYAKLIRDMLILHIPDTEEEQKFLDTFYLEEDKFKGVECCRIHANTIGDGTLYPLQIISENRGDRSGFVVSPIVIRKMSDDLIIHEIVHTMSRDVTVRLYRSRNKLNRHHSFLARHQVAEEILAYLSSGKLVSVFKKESDLVNGCLIKKYKVRKSIRRNLMYFRKTMIDCIGDNTKAELDFMFAIGMVDKVTYRLKTRKQMRRKRHAI